MTQAQCPNCGGFKVSENPIRVKEKLNARPLTRREKFFWDNLAWIGTIAALTIIGIPLFIVIVLIFRTRFKTVQRVTGASYNCSICGYTWTRNVGDPFPSVTVRPDLISAGEQRLQEEEHRRQQQQQRDAEAAYWLSQQNKK